MKKIIILVIFLLFSFCHSQNADYFKKDTVYINYSKEIYNKIAMDSLKFVYNLQNKFASSISKKDRQRLLFTNYRIQDLELFSIPMYRIFSDAEKQYDCDDNIENFIAFEEHLIYQEVLVFHDKKIITHFSVPDYFDERERIQNPSAEMEPYFSDKPRKNDRIKKLSNSYTGRYFIDWNSVINYKNKKDNFYFMIFGLDGVLCEVNKEDNLVYSYDLNAGADSSKKLLNEYIRKNKGIDIIRQLSRSYYIDKFGINKININPCTNTNKRNVKIIINKK